MKCAIYCRRSTVQRGDPAARSTVRQRENAEAFAAKMGWTVVNVFVDEATSGAKEHRSGLDALMASAKRGAFAVVIVSEMKTIARELSLGLSLIKRLAQAGVLVYEYGQGRCLTPKNARERIVAALELFGADDYREGTALRVREGHKKHAELGHVVGGRIYGYKNRPVYNGETDASGNLLRSYVLREVDPSEAAVVLRIFTLYAEGAGLKRIARELTEAGITSPRPNDPAQSLKAWAPSTVRAILDRSLYAGRPEWGRRQKRDSWGAVHVTKRPEAEVVKRTDEQLRIVPDELWLRVRAGRGDAAKRTTPGRPKRGGEHSLLAGLASCVCGGGLDLEAGRYRCSRRRRHGKHVCQGISIPAAEAEAAVLREVEEHVLTPEAVEEFLVRIDAQQPKVRNVERELRDVKAREARLVALVEAGDAPRPIVARLRELGARRAALEAATEAQKPVKRPSRDVISSRLAHWRTQLRASTTRARDVLARALAGRVRFNELPGGIIGFEADTRFSRLLTGFVVEDQQGDAPAYVRLGDRRGHEAGDAERAAMEERFETVLRNAEETYKGVRPWWDSNPRSPP